MSDKDYVSSCCKAKIKRVKFDGGSHPACTKCGKGCNSDLPGEDTEDHE